LGHTLANYVDVIICGIDGFASVQEELRKFTLSKNQSDFPKGEVRETLAERFPVIETDSGFFQNFEES
jgi:hypothetical protein